MGMVLPALPFTLARRDAQGEAGEQALLTLRFEEHNGEWCGTCLELGTAAEGDSLEEASEALKEAVLLQITEAEKRGFLRELLQDRNVRLTPVERERREGWELVSVGAL